MGVAQDDPIALEEVEHGATIRVTEGEGINLQMNARVAHAPDDVYEVLTDPEAACVFRSIQACLKRTILEEDKRKGTRKLAVSHRAISRFLFIRITFETHLLVWENDRERSIRFTNAKEGFMKKFEGNWHVRPFNQQSLNMATASKPATASAPASMPAWMNPAALMAAAQRLLPAQQNDVSLVTLEQRIATSQQPPPPIRALVRRLVSKQLRDMMEDLRNELDRRAKAKATGQQSHERSRATSSEDVATPAAPHKAGQAVTASITSSPFPDIWQYVEPLVSIIIQL